MESNQILPVNSRFTKRNLNQDPVVQQKLKAKAGKQEQAERGEAVKVKWG